MGIKILEAFTPFPTLLSKAFFLLRVILPFPKLEEVADDNFILDENGRKFSKQVENTVGKGDIACYEQYLLFPQCFQKDCTADR